MWQRSYDESPTLYLVPTPIGNMEDITYRAINILNSVAVIFSEDTRETSMLLNHYGIKNKLIALHDHNENLVKEQVLDYLEKGFSIALVTDRGTPIISDPGYKTVKYVTEKGFNVVSLPGPTAFVPALTVSGINPQPFLFYGFLDSKDVKRKKELNKLKEEEATLIFYEAPHRIIKTLQEMLDIFGNREISISREISKKFESVYRGSLENVLSNFDNVKGEFVIIVEGVKESHQNFDIDIVEHVNLYVKNGLSIMDAIKKVARDRGVSKSEIYHEYHMRRK